MMPAPQNAPSRALNPWQTIVGPALFVLAIVALVAALPPQGAPSRDFLALWLAGDFVAAGKPELIYPPATALFEMRPPLEWYARAVELGRPAPVYPFLYPPIWAWVMAAGTQIMALPTALALAFGANLALLAALPMLAVRLACEHLSRRALWIFYATALALLIGTHSGLIALLQGQPQILAAFLTLLALERAEAGRAGPAGIALGFAIALKLSPLPVVLIWLVAGGGRWRAALIALAVAAALGLASVAVAGWSLHRTFLDQLGVIGHTLMMNLSVASMDMLYGIRLPTDLAQPIAAVPAGVPSLPSAAMPGEGIAWVVAAKPAPYALMQNLMQLGLACAAGVALRFAPNRLARAAVLAVALGVLAFTAPIGWLYYYIVPHAFAGLIVLQGRSAVRSLLLLGTVPLALERFAQVWMAEPPVYPQLPSLTVATYLLALLIFALQSMAPKPARQP